ncbi:MAG: (2Fe-2S)-binding protein [Gammaproteobacteria bacterium]|nr:MAG: (2Fe-2S)-binding protein [Gammaproteobacteria bacterium]
MTELTINNKSYQIDGASFRSLAKVLRDDLGLMGTKVSCDEGECGSCTVLMDGKAVTSCLVLVDQAEGKKIETIEGMAKGEELHPIQQAFIDEQGFQCGACTPGFIMSAKAFLDENPEPTKQQAAEAMSGNICRCGAHPYIVNAVLNAANKIQSEV